MAQVKDVVCGMEVDTQSAIPREYQGKTYYFCAEGCAREFAAHPEAYLSGEHLGHHGHAHS